MPSSERLPADNDDVDDELQKNNANQIQSLYLNKFWILNKQLEIKLIYSMNYLTDILNHIADIIGLNFELQSTRQNVSVSVLAINNS